MQEMLHFMYNGLLILIQLSMMEMEQLVEVLQIVIIHMIVIKHLLQMDL